MTRAQSKHALLAGVQPSLPVASPSTTLPDRIERTLERIESGEQVRSAWLAEHIDRKRLYEWRDRSSDNAQHYAPAREMQVDAIAEDALRIADDASGDARYGPRGELAPDHEFQSRNRLRFDARRRYVAALAPRPYGTHASVDVSGSSQSMTILSGVPVPETS